eukprot:g10074.t1
MVNTAGANSTGRASLRGVEGLVFDLVYQALSLEQWASWLEAPLELAASQGNVSLAQKLLRAGGEIGISLHRAVRGGHAEVVGALLDGGASCNNKDGDGDAPLHIASAVGHADIARSLLLRGADKDSLDIRGRAPLHVAAEYGHLAVAEVLLGANADLNIRFDEDDEYDDDERIETSPLDMAAATGHLDILRAIVHHGGAAALNAVDHRGHTALHHASRSGAVGSINSLVEAGAVIAPSAYGSTPLHFAATWSNAEATLALLRHGAEVSPQTVAGNSPLHWVTEYAGMPGSAENVAVLLRWGADETMRNATGFTPGDLVGHNVDESDVVAEEVERVKALLLQAPAERAWRRRGLLVLCRAHLDRVRPWGQLRKGPSEEAVRTAPPKTRSRAKRAAAEAGRADQQGGGEGGDWRSAAGWVLGLEEEGLFRTIVGYL